MPHSDCQKPSPDKSPQGRRTQKRTLLGSLRMKSYLSKGGWKSQAFLSPIPEWSVGVSLMLVSLVHLPNGRSSTERDKRKIIVLKGAWSAPPIHFQLRRQTEQREDSSHHQHPPPQLGASSSHMLLKERPTCPA